MTIFGTAHWRNVTRPYVLSRDGFTCQVRILGVCANLSGKRMSPSRLEVDHKVPRSEGGSDNYENLRASCPPCNKYLAGKSTGNQRRYNSRDW